MRWGIRIFVARPVGGVWLAMMAVTGFPLTLLRAGVVPLTAATTPTLGGCASLAAAVVVGIGGGPLEGDARDGGA